MRKRPYVCPRCAYCTHEKNNMRKHLYHVAKVCPATHEDIELTDEVKEYIMKNRVYRATRPKPAPTQSPSTAPIPSAEQNDYSLIMRTPEKYYQKIVEKYLGGTHKKLACGTTDVTTIDTHAEIKIWKSYKEALGQLIAYNFVDPKEHLQAYFFGRTVEDDVDLVKALFSSVDIECYTFVESPGTISIMNLQTNESVYDYKVTSKHN